MHLDWSVTDKDGETLANGSGPLNNVLHVRADLGNHVIGRVSGVMQIPVSHHEQIFINGYQTWTQCAEYTYNDKIRGLKHVPGLLNDRFGFDRYGDYHFVDYPEKNGLLHGFSWCVLRRGGYCRLIASLDERAGYTMLTLDCTEETLTFEKDCSGVKADGEYPLFDLFYAEGTLEQVYDAWFQKMNIHPRTQEKLCGYSSWYNRYQKIDEKAILEDLSGCREIFEAHDLFQVDDGWEKKIGDWEGDEKKFPDGMKKMADEIHEAGYRAGLWLAPFAAEKESALVREHPDWLLKVDGEPWFAGGNWSGFYALDIDHPEVIAYLQKVFSIVLNDWGYDLVKLDFLYAAAPYGNERESRAGRMYRALELLRSWCGDKLILGCGVPVMPAFGIVDYCRIGCDVTLNWDDAVYMRLFHRERPSTKNAIGNMIARRALNGRAYLNDPDVFFLRTENLKLNDKRKEALAKLCALTGGVFLTSDNPSSYTKEMITAYRQLRNMTKATDVSIKMIGERISVDYRLDGYQHNEILL